jgi:PAS domain S-box-containing protein
MSMSIKHRIYLISLVFASLFILNRIVAFISIYKTRNAASNVINVIDPSLTSLNDFRAVIVQAKMCTASWVFIPDNQTEKNALLKIHEQYPILKTKLLQFSQQWKTKDEVDSLKLALSKFEGIVSSQKTITSLLHQADDYDDQVRKSKAEEIFKENISAKTDSLTRTIDFITLGQNNLKQSQQNIVAESLKKLWSAIIILTIVVICGVFILSKYLGNLLSKPLTQIRNIIDNLSNGITNKIERKYKQDEIGKMVTAINNLSVRLSHAALFAQNIGERNFDVSFQPMSEQDVLGKALVAMRDNLKFIDESVNEAQRIAKIGSWRWDLKLNKVFWSDELYNIFEKERSSFTPSLEAFAACVHPDDRELAIDKVKKSLDNHQQFSYQCRIVCENGVVKKIFAQGKVSVDEKGNAVTMFGLAQDITLQVEREEELVQTTERFHNLSKATDDSIWDWNLTTDEVWWNDNFYKVFGYDPSKGIPTLGEWILKMHPDDRIKIVAKLKGIKNITEDSWRDEFRYFRKDGTIGIGLNRAYIIRNHEGMPLRVIGAIHDITERRKAQQQLADSEKRYRQIVETAQEGIWLIDENDCTVFVNKKMCEMLEYAQQEIIGKPNYFFKDEEERKIAMQLIERRKRGISEQYEGSYITKSGKCLWVSVSANPVFDDEGNYKGALGMLTDITQRKLQEELLKKSEADLEIKNRALEQKNTELEQFAYIASHDLQEPLRTVSSFTDHFQKLYKDKVDDAGQKYLYFIQQGTERMKILITDLLDYSRIGRGKELKPVDCNEIINTIIADLDTAIQESKVEIKTETLPVVSGYTTEMKQLFQNLVVNAIKFRKKEVAPKIHISSQPINGGWEFTVQDNGIGIDEQFNERIFAIFQRLHTRNEYEGSGIGLSHCKKIVELHGGKIWVNSKPGEGSIFHFTILENHN